MELLFFAATGAVLYVADRITDYMADQAAGTAFEQIHEVIGNVSYFGRSSQPILKTRIPNSVVPFFPAFTQSFKVLSLTECDHWFWFTVRVHLFRVENIAVKPITKKEAKLTLSNNAPERLQQYFPEDVAKSRQKKSA